MSIYRDTTLAGETALITGGRRGIGRGIALAFAEAGADVVVCDKVTDDGKLEAVANEIQSLGRRSLAVRADTTSRADIDNLVSRTIEKFGKIDILVNNAGIIIRTSILEAQEKDWDDIMNTDLKAYFMCAQAVGKQMAAKKKGVIINIASQWAYRSGAPMGIYSVAKAGVVMLTRVLARELAEFNIRVNTIAPGVVKTEFSMPGGRPAAAQPQGGQALPAIPLGRMGEVEDIAPIAVFLASPASGYITGETLLADGGNNA
jgi:dehydrogenase/reductase SDR family protein 4